LNISIFGLGYVGCVSLGCLAKNGHNIIGVDLNENKVNLINSGKPTIVEKDIDELINEQFLAGKIRATLSTEEAILNSDLSIIAVGTPSTNTGHLNLEYIFKLSTDIAQVLIKKNSFHVIAIRSTVLPGTCAKAAEMIESISKKKNNIDFAVASNPEFLREGTAVYDYYNPPFTLIGSENPQAIDCLKNVYENINSEIMVAPVKVAEILKYVNNTFHALKVSFVNEVSNICKSVGIDSNKVMDIFIKDTQLNISPYYLKPGFAYGGSCLPKDLKALKTLAHDNYLDTPVINSIDKSNGVQINRALDLITNFGKKKIGFLGLSFKAETDDLRNSPSVIVIETLLGKGFNISIFDQKVSYSKLTGRNKEFIDNHIPHLSKLLVDSLDKLIDESEIIVISNKDKQYIEILKGIEDKVIVDLTNLHQYFGSKQNYFGFNW